MNKTSLSRVLLLAGVLAAAGVAQAQSYDVPQQAGEASTMTNGAPNQLTTNSPYSDGTVVIDTTILGAPPATVITTPGQTIVTTTTYTGPVVTYYTPMVPHHLQGRVAAPVFNNPDTDTIYNSPVWSPR